MYPPTLSADGPENVRKERTHNSAMRADRNRQARERSRAHLPNRSAYHEKQNMEERHRQVHPRQKAASSTGAARRNLPPSSRTPTVAPRQKKQMTYKRLKNQRGGRISAHPSRCQTVCGLPVNMRTPMERRAPAAPPIRAAAFCAPVMCACLCVPMRRLLFGDREVYAHALGRMIFRNKKGSPHPTMDVQNPVFAVRTVH